MPVLDFVDWLVAFRVVPVLVLVDFLAVFFRAVPVLALVDFLATFRLVVFRLVVFLTALVLVLVDFLAVFFRAGPVLVLVDFLAIFRLVVFRAAPALAFVDLVFVFDLPAVFRAVVLEVVRVAISVGSCGYSNGCLRALDRFTLAPEFAKQSEIQFCTSYLRRVWRSYSEL